MLLHNVTVTMKPLNMFNVFYISYKLKQEIGPKRVTFSSKYNVYD